MYIFLISHNVHNEYMCSLQKELPPVNLAVAACDSSSVVTSKLVTRSVTVCSMGPSTARGVKITGLCRSLPLRAGAGRRRLAALSGLPPSATRQQIFWSSYCNPQRIVGIDGEYLITQASTTKNQYVYPVSHSLSHLRHEYNADGNALHFQTGYIRQPRN